MEVFDENRPLVASVLPLSSPDDGGCVTCPPKRFDGAAVPCVPPPTPPNNPAPCVADGPKREPNPDCWPGWAAEKAKSPLAAAGCCCCCCCCCVVVLPNSPP